MNDQQRDEFDQDDVLRERLGAADPARSLPPADPAGVARMLEDVMSRGTEEGTESSRTGPDRERPAPGGRTSGRGRRSSLTWVIAAAATAVIVGVGTAAVLTQTDDVPTAGSDPRSSPTRADPTRAEPAAPSVNALTYQSATGRCATPSAALIARSTLAFKGTVTDVTADVVTLSPSEFFVGTPTDEVQVTTMVAAGGFGATDLGPDFQVGRNYLVAAQDGMVSPCWSNQTSPSLKGLYDEAFPG